MIRKLFFILLFLTFTFFSYKYFQSHIFTLHFVDEDENIIAGYYMGKGDKLYKDIFSHKQPLPAVVSMFEQKIQKPNSLFLLIKRHREIVYFYSIAWTLIIIVAFGLPGLIFGILFEIVKQFQLGNMFLSESLVVFPLIYTLGYLWKILNHPCHSRAGGNPDLLIETGYRIKCGMTNMIETLLFSFSLSLILFLQFTLIPYVFFVIFTLVLFKKINKKLFLILNSCFLILFLFCSFFVDYFYYFDNTINAIKSIYLDGSAASNPWNMFYYSFLRPFAVILEMKKSEFGTFTGIISIGYLLSLFYLFISQKNLRKTLILIYLLLGLCSLRIVYPDKTIYSGFHGLPWIGAFLFITIYQISLVIASCLNSYSYALSLRAKRSNLLVFISCCLFLIVFCYYGFFLIRDYYRPSNRETDWYVNYSRFYDYGQTIRILSSKRDKLMVLPTEQLIYWQSGLPHASRFLYVYLFVDPKYKKELYDYWEKTPPAFIYDEDNLSLFKKWWPKYIRIKKEKNDTPLFIRKDKIKSLKPWQINEIKRLNFNL